jgi:hypothetical protein
LGIQISDEATGWPAKSPAARRTLGDEEQRDSHNSVRAACADAAYDSVATDSFIGRGTDGELIILPPMTVASLSTVSLCSCSLPSLMGQAIEQHHDNSSY